MAAETPSPTQARPKPVPGLAWVRLPRTPWAYAGAAAVLLALSQLLWLWHSWPVREILDAERPAAGATV